MSKIGRDRFVDTWNLKATSERDAIASCARKILIYRKWTAKITPFIAKCFILGFIGGFVGWTLYLTLTTDKFQDIWVSAVILPLMFAYLGGVLWLTYASAYKANDPLYDWAEDYRELLEERREFRKEECEQDLPRRKF